MTAAVLRNSCFLRRLVSANVFPVVPPLLSFPALDSRLDRVVFKVFRGAPNVVTLYDSRRFSMPGSVWTHKLRWCSNKAGGVIELAKLGDGGNAATNVGAGDGKLKRKKLKGKRAVVRWMKFFRYKKKKEYERMTAEEKILYKLKKARKKEERLVESLKKIEPSEKSETMHDPEILTPEEHFFFLKMGLKSKNYVPLGRRGIYQGVILNMHLHWKKHQTLQVVVKTFSPEEVKEIAVELARLTGGIVLDIHKENTIIMYRGKNYCQPPTEIMSPRVTLSRRKALDKSKYRDGLRAVRKYIPRLEQDLDLFQAQNRTRREESNTDVVGESHCVQSAGESHEPKKSVKLKEILSRASESLDDDVSSLDLSMPSDSEDLSDIFETESESESEVNTGDGHNILLDAFDKLPANNGSDTEDFEDHLREMYTVDSLTAGKQSDSPKFDEVDRMFIRSASLLKKHRR